MPIGGCRDFPLAVRSAIVRRVCPDPLVSPSSTGPARVTAIVVATVTLLAVNGCTDTEAVTPVQQVDWRNGPYGVGCDNAEPVELVDGRTPQSSSVQVLSSGVGFAQLDGVLGDEAVVEQSCGSDAIHLSVWTAGEDRPRLIGAVPGTDVRSWEEDRGVLCVLFNLPESTQAEARPFRTGSSAVEPIPDMTCTVDGVSFVFEDDPPEG